MLLGSRINSTIGYLGFCTEGDRSDEDGRAKAVAGKETSVSCLSWGRGGCWVSDVVRTVALVSSVLRHDYRMVSFCQPLSDVGDL